MQIGPILAAAFERVAVTYVRSWLQQFKTFGNQIYTVHVICCPPLQIKTAVMMGMRGCIPQANVMDVVSVFLGLPATVAIGIMTTLLLMELRKRTPHATTSTTQRTGQSVQSGDSKQSQSGAQREVRLTVAIDFCIFVVRRLLAGDWPAPKNSIKILQIRKDLFGGFSCYRECNVLTSKNGALSAAWIVHKS